MALTILWVLALATCVSANNVSVVRITMSMEEEHSITLDSSVEYILEFIPNGEQSMWPSRLQITSGGGDTARPVLVTARQRTGAQTWQLPYMLGEQRLFALQRVLCPDDGVDHIDDPSCAEGGVVLVRGQFSLHVSTACAARVEVRVRVDAARDWLLSYDLPTLLTTTQTAPGVMHYRWAGEEQTSVRLVAASEDDVCATLAVYNYSCPVPATQEHVARGGLRMTMQNSGAVQLSRSQYPRGFFVIAILETTDDPCVGEREVDSDWLWEVAVVSAAQETRDLPSARVKHINLTVRASLSITQYLVAAAATIALFLSFYVAFGVLVFAQRWDKFKKIVEPKAVLADIPGAENGLRTEVDGSPTRRARRDSTATFDSSDNSDSDEEEPDSTSPSPTPTVTSPTTDTSPTSVTSPTTTTTTPATPVTTPAAGDASAARSVPVLVSDATVANGGENGEGDRNGTQRTVAAGAGVGSVAGGDRAAQTPFGLPAHLRVAALSRRRARTLRARSDRYLHTLYTVAVFYALPVIQFVAAFQIVLNVSGSLDLCYYNFLCAHPAGALSDFNHVFSNLGYLLLGALFLFQLRRRRARRARKPRHEVLNVSGSLDLCYYNFLCAHPAGALSDFNHVFSNLGYLLLGALFLFQLRRRRARRARKPRHEEYGIPVHYGLLESLGAGMMVVALLSASYHVCPNQLNFQFDTAFMYVLAVLSMVKIYQARHPDVNARAHATFGVLAVLIALVVWGVLGGGALFWSMWTVLHVFTFLVLSLRIYYLGQFRLDKQWVRSTTREIRALGVSVRPLYSARLVLLLIANAVNWGFALYGLFTMAADFAGHLLTVLLANTLMHMVFYLTMKLLHGERLRWYAWLYLGGAAAAWAPALYFFVFGSSDWSATPAQSRHSNHECKVLQFYDSHDLWHALSAVALYLSFNAMLTWDDGLSAVKRTEIAVF